MLGSPLDIGRLAPDARGRRSLRLRPRLLAAFVSAYSPSQIVQRRQFPGAHMTTHQRNFPSIDPQKLERLAETAVKVGLRLQPGQDLFLTAPVSALPLARRIVAEAYKAGAGLVTPILSDEEITLARYRFAPDASFDRAPGWLYEGVGKAFAANTARLAIVGDDPMLLVAGRPGQGRARQQGQFDRLPAGAREDRRLRHQLEHRRLSDRLMGEPCLSGRRGGGRGRQARGSDLLRFPRRQCRSGSSLGRAQCGARPADGMAERETISRAPLFRSGHGSHHRPRRRSRLAGRRGDGEERNHLQPEHSDRRGLHDAACAPGRRPCRQHQAALLSGHAHRQHRGPL